MFMEAKYKIGYIDEDIRQVKKYTRRLKDFGFEVIGYDFHQGMSLEELMSQVYESDIDLLMIDYKLNEGNIVAFNGDAVESDFYDKRPLFPHIIFTNKVEQAEPFVEDWKIIFDNNIEILSFFFSMWFLYCSILLVKIVTNRFTLCSSFPSSLKIFSLSKSIFQSSIKGSACSTLFVNIMCGKRGLFS